jgi:hypothetical protein
MIIFAGQGGGGFGCSTFSTVSVLSNANGLGGPPVWTELATNGGPPPGQYAPTAVYDPNTNRMTIFGGAGFVAGSCTVSNAVWALQNANGLGGSAVWTNVVPEGAPGSPAARNFHSAVYNPLRNEMTIFGGGTAIDGFTNDVWMLMNANGIGNNPAWKQLATTGESPIPRNSHTSVLDPASNRMIIFGGDTPPCCDTFTNDVWTLNIATNQAALIITAVNASRPYGSANPSFSFTTTGLVNGDTLATIGVAPVCSTTATSGSPVGSYPITCSGPSATANYSITYQQGTLNITPVPLAITANNAIKILDAPSPALTATYSGFVNGDTPSSLAGTLSCTSAATTTSPVGSYPINCSGQSSNNYVIAYVAGTLNIVYASGGVCDGDLGHQILSPINADGSSVYNQGRTVPAKFRVCDANGVSIGTAGVVSSFYLTQILTGTASTTVQEIVNTNNPDTAFRWDPTNMQWIFNITTQNLSAGSTYIYTITLNDGSSIVFQYGLR